MSSKVVARRSNIHGTGVFARQDMKRGERIIEYKGLRRSHDDVDADDAGDAESGHTFLFTLNEEWVIDGNHRGNVAKWINFSCSPNAEAVLEETEGKDRRRDRVFIEARRAIKAGDELTYDYNITLDVPHTARMKKIWECRCGAKTCRGTMLKLKAPAKKAVVKKVAAKKASVKKVTKAVSTNVATVARKSAGKVVRKDVVALKKSATKAVSKTSAGGSSPPKKSLAGTRASKGAPTQKTAGKAPQKKSAAR